MCVYVIADPSLQEAEYAMTLRQDFGSAIKNAEMDVGPFMSPTPYTIQVRSTHRVTLCVIVQNSLEC